ncbi:MAG TPA: imidazolonepropionase, partial [Flavisolibacter sp.]|nr:imidazolonepropionase [Flavisolibacter sp.]
MATLFTNIQTLVNARENAPLLRGKELSSLPCIENAYLVVEGNAIASYGKMSELKFKPSAFASHHDLSGRCVLPAWCDSHTHLVFVGSRENEFVDKIKGLSYADIAARGGGILNSAK